MLPMEVMRRTCVPFALYSPAGDVKGAAGCRRASVGGITLRDLSDTLVDRKINRLTKDKER